MALVKTSETDVVNRVACLLVISGMSFQGQNKLCLVAIEADAGCIVPSREIQNFVQLLRPQPQPRPRHSASRGILNEYDSF